MQKFLFKLVARIHTWLYRLTGGRLGSQMSGLNVLLLTSRGRKSGKNRTTPLGYIMDGDNFVIIASNGGLDNHPAWYHNLRSTPLTTIQVRERVIRVNADRASAAERQRLWQTLIQTAPGYANYEKRTSREIPLVILQPASV